MSSSCGGSETTAAAAAAAALPVATRPTRLSMGGLSSKYCVTPKLSHTHVGRQHLGLFFSLFIHFCVCAQKCFFLMRSKCFHWKKKHTLSFLSVCSLILIYTRNVHRLWAAIKQKSCASLDGSSESAHPSGKSVSAVALREHVPACLLSLEVNELLEYNLEMQVMSNEHFFLFRFYFVAVQHDRGNRGECERLHELCFSFHMQLINLELLFVRTAPRAARPQRRQTPPGAPSQVTISRNLNTMACCMCLESDTVAVDDLPVRLRNK